jgi:hypothetical protein
MTTHPSLAPPESDKMTGPIISIQSAAPHPQVPALPIQSLLPLQAFPIFTSTQMSTLLLRLQPRLRTQVQPWYNPRMHPSHFQDVAPTHTNVRLSRLQIWADGLPPFTVEVDSLTSPPKPYSRVMLRLKLSLPPGEVESSVSTLHGFGGAIVLSEPWLSSGKCFTRVFTANTCVSKELDYLQPTNQSLTAFLPDSWLTKSRWLEASTSISFVILPPGDLRRYQLHVPASPNKS